MLKPVLHHADGSVPSLLYADGLDLDVFFDANGVGSGKITYVQVDKNELSNAKKAERFIASDGTPCVMGSYKGDYWMFETSLGTPLKAGYKVNVTFQCRVQSKGLAYWTAEYFNGTEWVPTKPTTNATIEGQTFDYNYQMTGNTYVEINETVNLTTTLDNFKFRFICTSLISTAGAVVEGASGYNVRIGGIPVITLIK